MPKFGKVRADLGRQPEMAAVRRKSGEAHDAFERCRARQMRCAVLCAEAAHATNLVCEDGAVGNRTQGAHLQTVDPGTSPRPLFAKSATQLALTFVSCQI